MLAKIEVSTEVLVLVLEEDLMNKKTSMLVIKLVKELNYKLRVKLG